MGLNEFFCAARAALGSIYLLFPELAVRSAGSSHDERRVRATARILGARHLVQALATSGRPPAAVLALGAEADAAHAASMAVLGLLSRRWRRAALADALIATTLTVTGIAAAVRAGPTEPADPGWRSVRNRYASRLASVLIPSKVA
jgi:hypothetical protein